MIQKHKYLWAERKVCEAFPNNTGLRMSDYNEECGVGVSNGKSGDEQIRTSISFVWYDPGSNTHIDINKFSHKEEWLDKRIEQIKEILS